MPDPELLQGDTQQVMAWVILAMVVLFTVTCFYFIRRLKHWEDKYDKLLDKYDKLNMKTLKIAVRSQRAIEALANLPAPEIEADLENGDDDS